MHPDSSAVAALPLLWRDGSLRAYTYLDADLAADPDIGGRRWSFGDGYAIRRVARQRIALHRVVLGLEHGGPEVDHINWDTLDNRRCNLRPASRAENAQNLPVRSASGLRNVYWDPRRNAWLASAYLAGTHHFIGRFPTMLDAIAARDEWYAEHMPFAVDIPVPPISHEDVRVLPAAPSRRGRNGSHAQRAISIETAREIRARRLAGERGRDLAREFGVREQLVCCIAKGRKYVEEAA